MATMNMPADPAWNAMVTVDRLEALLPTELFVGSKDWVASDVVGRVEWLLAMYASAKAERVQLLTDLEDISSGDRYGL
jgi:hypothetical protein